MNLGTDATYRAVSPKVSNGIVPPKYKMISFFQHYQPPNMKVPVHRKYWVVV